MRIVPILRIFTPAGEELWGAARVNDESVHPNNSAVARSRARSGLERILYSCKRRHSRVIRRGSCDAQSLFQVVSDAECIGHDGQRGVNGGAGREKTAVHDIKIVDLVRLAIRVQRRRPGVATEPNRAVLVSHAGKRNSITDEQIPREKPFMTLVAVNAAFGLLLHEFFELGKQTAVRLFVVRCVLQNDFPVAVNGDAIVWVRQIFRGDPEAEGMLGHEVQSPTWSNGWSPGGERRSVELGDKGDVAHRMVPLLRAKIEIVYCERFLVDRGIWALRDRKHH